MTNPCYVFDIDGTMADGTHRIHLISEAPKDWDAYFARCIDDAPIPHMIELARVLAKHCPIVNVSGRRESTRADTLQWMWRQKVFPAAIYMRGDKDHRNDDLLKIELLGRMRDDGWEPIMVFDDRTRVVDAWRAAGVPCAQVAPGDF